MLPQNYIKTPVTHFSLAERRLIFLLLLILCILTTNGISQSIITATSLTEKGGGKSVARQWNEVMLEAIRKDYTRPPVHARNLFHFSIALYDCWAVYEPSRNTYMLGKTVRDFTCHFDSVRIPLDIQAAREKAMSYAAYTLLKHRFSISPNAEKSIKTFTELMQKLGYDPSFTSIDYHDNDPASLGNYIAWSLINMGNNDGSNEKNNYAPLHYKPVNTPLVFKLPGNTQVLDPNRWQPLKLDIALDQNGNPVAGTQKFQSPEWGNITPFALQENDCHSYERGGATYKVYYDPGPPPVLNLQDANDSISVFLKQNIVQVVAWSAHLNPVDGIKWDISPGRIGNLMQYPLQMLDALSIYRFYEGGDIGKGHAINPKTKAPYLPNRVLRGDYARVLAAYWADGPNSETPPGHWFTILNQITDHTGFTRQFEGQGPALDPLEWDVKAYFLLGGALHDAAIAAWGIKGWYDAARPIALFRYMAGLGQCSDSKLASYHPGGLPLIPGFIEIIGDTDPLVTKQHETSVGKIKVNTWKGHSMLSDKDSQIAGSGWILAEEWCPFQKETFVTPPFAGYISGHSTFSRAAAEVLTLLTGDDYFPGGVFEYTVRRDSKFLNVEKGPSTDITLQWATYKDAADQCSLSRIWGGLHPPYDDIPGRIIGEKIGNNAFNFGKNIFQNNK